MLVIPWFAFTCIESNKQRHDSAARATAVRVVSYLVLRRTFIEAFCARGCRGGAFGAFLARLISRFLRRIITFFTSFCCLCGHPHQGCAAAATQHYRDGQNQASEYGHHRK